MTPHSKKHPLDTFQIFLLSVEVALPNAAHPFELHASCPPPSPAVDAHGRLADRLVLLNAVITHTSSSIQSQLSPYFGLNPYLSPQVTLASYMSLPAGLGMTSTPA